MKLLSKNLYPNCRSIPRFWLSPSFMELFTTNMLPNVNISNELFENLFIPNSKIHVRIETRIRTRNIFIHTLIDKKDNSIKNENTVGIGFEHGRLAISWRLNRLFYVAL